MESFGGGKKEEGFNHEDLHKFGDLLRRAREAITPNLSLAKAAKQFGVSLGSLAKWELGSSIPEEDKLPAIAEFYKIDLSVLKEVYDVSKRAKESQTSARGLKTPGGAPKVKRDPNAEVFEPLTRGRHTKRR